MLPLPCRSPGVLLSAVADDAVVYDLVTETVHHLNASAGALLAACDGVGDLEGLVASWSQQTGTSPEALDEEVTTALGTFRELGLVDRTASHDPPPAPAGSTGDTPPDAVLGLTHPVIDHRIALRSTDLELLATLDASLGGGLGDEPTLVLDVTRAPTGEIALTGDEHRVFSDVASLAGHLPSILTGYAVRTPTCAVLHAAGVRSPDGDVVLLPAPSGSGKSTLTAALVAAGWDYLSDEAVGIRAASLAAVGYPKPISLQPSGSAAAGLPPVDGVASGGDDESVQPEALRLDTRRLHGDVGTVTRILLCTWEPDAEVRFDDLTPHDALIGLLANTLNLAHCGETGLETLCDLATSVPVQRLRYGGVASVLGAL